MGLFDRFKKKEAAPVATPAPVIQPEPEKKGPKICLDEDVLMAGIPTDFDESDDNEAYWDELEEIKENWDEDPEGSFEKMLTLAKAGASSAMFWVAAAYERGNGAPRDDEEFHRWLWRCMYAGDSAACGMAAGCYAYGDDIVPQDIVKAFELYLKAYHLSDEAEFRRDDVEEIINSITQGTFELLYDGTPQQALEITKMYKDYLG